MKLFNNLTLVAFAAVALLLGSCDKTKPYDVDVAPPFAHFVGKATQLYEVVDNTTPAYKVQLGSTDVSGSDRVVTYKVTSPSGAIGGTHYTIATGNNAGTVTIKGGEAIANITVQADLATYIGGRKDTLVFSLSEPSMKIADFMDTVVLVIRSGCNEGLVTIADLSGDYDNTNEDFGGPYGPYTTTITSATSTSATTGTIVVDNIFDAGWAPITFNLDWTNSSNRLVTLDRQFGIAPASTVSSNPAYTGWEVMVETAVAGPGTFSACNQTVTLKLRVGILDPATGNGGWFGTPYTVNMAR
jgi:hypothetical protein